MPRAKKTEAATAVLEKPSDCIIVDQRELSQAIATVAKAVPSRPSHPVLTCILLVSDGTKISLTGFDLSLGIQASITPSVIPVRVARCIPAKLFSDIVSRLDGELSLEFQEDTLTIKSIDGEYELNTMSADEFPELPTIGNEPFFIEPALLREGVQKTVPFVSSDESKQVLTGVRIASENHTLRIYATDGHRVGRFTKDLTEGVIIPLSGITIPSTAMIEIQRALSATEGDEPIQVSCDETLIRFEFSDLTITSRLLEGAYPNLEQLIPQQFVRSLTVNRKELLKRLERISVIAEQKNNVVRISINDLSNQAIITVDAASVGKGSETIDLKVEGGSVQIAFDVRYLIGCLKVIGTESVRILLNSPTSPVIVTPLESLDYKHLIMPCQIRD